jgi:ligand-binding SRPBCC domain-containing protein
MKVELGRRGGVCTVDAEQFIPCPLEEVFSFFAEAQNLQAITPHWLHFEILTPLPITMRAGAWIDYRLRLRGIPIRWRTEITEWEPPLRFVDVQRRGPYRLWRHEHTFERRDGGTLARDHVDYRVFGGALVDRLFVRPDVRKIFAYRQRVLSHYFEACAGSARRPAPVPGR